jgi:hypothetical protein
VLLAGEKEIFAYCIELCYLTLQLLHSTDSTKAKEWIEKSIPDKFASAEIYLKKECIELLKERERRIQAEAEKQIIEESESIVNI